MVWLLKYVFRLSYRGRWIFCRWILLADFNLLRGALLVNCSYRLVAPYMHWQALTCCILLLTLALPLHIFLCFIFCYSSWVCLNNVLLVSSLSNLTTILCDVRLGDDIALIFGCPIQVSLSLTLSTLHLTSVVRRSSSARFDKLSSFTLNFLRALMHLIILPIFFHLFAFDNLILILLICIGGLGNVITSTDLWLYLLYRSFLLDVKLRLIFPFLLVESIAIRLLLIEILTTISIDPIIFIGHGLVRTALLFIVRQLTALILSSLILEVFYLWIINFNFLKVVTYTITISTTWRLLGLLALFHDVFHMLDFRFFVLIAKLMVHAPPNRRTRGRIILINWKNKFVTLAINLRYNMILLRVTLITSFIAVSFTYSTRDRNLTIWIIGIGNLLRINLVNLEYLAIASSCTELVLVLLWSFYAIRIRTYCILSHLTVYFATNRYPTLSVWCCSTSTRIFRVLGKRPVLHLF